MSEETTRKRFSLFNKKKPTTTDDSTESYDESFFEFELKSNNYHTCLIEASAVMKKGKYLGMPLPLRCTWYRATDEKEFVTIDSVTGAFYQPTADDIGCKICVHAVPVSEVQEYMGMPAFSEVGPIQIDPEMQNLIQEILGKSQVAFTAKVAGKPAIVSIDKEVLSVFCEENTLFRCNLIEKPPKVEINSKSNAGFTIVGEDLRLELTSDKLADRDFIVICIRSFCSKAQNMDIAEIMVKNQQLSSRLFEANKNYETSQITISSLKEELQNKYVIVQNLQENCLNLEKDLKFTKELLHRIQSENENFSSEIHFLRKDLLVYKEQYNSLESKIESQNAEEAKLKALLAEIKDDLEALTKVMICGTCKIDERLYMVIDKLLGNHTKSRSSRTSSVYSFQDEPLEIDKEKNKEFEVYSQQIKQMKDEFAEFMNKAEGEKNFFKRKAESLAVENDKLLTKLGKNPKEINEFCLEKLGFEEEKKKVFGENQKLLSRVKELESLVKINKAKLDSEINKNFELQKIIENKGTNSNTDYKKLVNSLTQTITDREAELSSQKKLNKEFMNRISELEALLSIVPQVN